MYEYFSFYFILFYFFLFYFIFFFFFFFLGGGGGRFLCPITVTKCFEVGLRGLNGIPAAPVWNFAFLGISNLKTNCII